MQDATTGSSDTESTVVRNRAVVPKNSGGSDQSSSGIVANPSLQVRFLSLPHEIDYSIFKHILNNFMNKTEDY